MRIEILKYLSDSYGHKPLNDFLKKISKGESIQTIAAILREMCAHGGSEADVIDLKSDLQYLGYHFKQLDNNIRAFSFLEQDPIADLDNTPLQARITHSGRKELEEYELRESLKQVNRSVIDTNKLIRLTGIGSVMFAALAFGITVLQYFKPGEITTSDIQELKQDISKLLARKPLTDTVYISTPPASQKQPNRR